MANDIVPYIGPKPPALVDSRGRPMRNSDLTREIGGPSVTGVRTIISGHPAQGLNPARLAQILRAAEHGDATAYLELAEEMEEKDLHYQAVLGTRKRAVAQLPIEVDAASDDPDDEADAQLIRDWLERDTLQAELFDILDAIGKGFSSNELIWGVGDLWLPERIERQDPRFFEFDKTDGKSLYLRGDSGMPEPLPQFKFMVHVHPAKSGLPIRGGLARAVAWGYLFKNFAIKDWVAFLEVYGLPLRVGKYNPGESEANIRKLGQAVAQIGSDAGAIIPTNMMIEFISSSGSGSSSTDMFEKKCTYIDQQISKAVLGQTATTDAVAGGLGSGQSTVHNDVRSDIQDADAVQLSATLNRDLVPWIIQFNRGPRKKYPRIRIGRVDPVDVEKALKSISAAVEMGVPVAISTFRKMTGLPEPKKGEELLEKPAPNSPQAPQEGGEGSSGAGKGKPALLDPLKTPSGAKKDEVAASLSDQRREPDGIDRAIEAELGDGWEALIAPALVPIDQLIAGAETLDEVRAGLVAAIDDMDVTRFAELLGRAGFGARIAGMVAKPER